MIVLREYQEDLIVRTRARMAAGVKRVCIYAPTGAGKTALTAEMVRRSAAKRMPAMFVVHRRELIRQTAIAFEAVGQTFGVISPDYAESRDELVQIASIDTLIRRLDRWQPPKLLVFDEAHHVTSEKWARVATWAADAFQIGLTATPERLDGTGLHGCFAELVLGPSTRSLIDGGWLAPYALYAPPTVDLTGVRTVRSDYDPQEIDARVTKPRVVGDTIEHYKRLTPDARAVIFAPTVKASKMFADEFRAAGMPAAHVDGTTPGHERDATMVAFARGDLRVVSNVDLFGEGFDLPAIETVILLRATQSLALYLQQVGRGLRTYPGKQRAVILDHVGNSKRLGLPCQPREWTLLGREKGKPRPKTETPIRQCPKCYAISPGRAMTCVGCGAPFESRERTIYERVDGKLVEVALPLNAEERRADEQQRAAERRQDGMRRRDASSREDLVQYAISKGFKRPHAWAHYVWASRQARARG